MKVIRRLIAVVLVICLFITNTFALPSPSVTGISDTPQMQYLKVQKLSQYLRYYHLDSGFNDDPILRAVQLVFDTDETLSQNRIRNLLLDYFKEDSSNYDEFALLMCQMYDEYSYYMTLEDYNANFGAPLDYEGIGIVVRPFGGCMIVKSVYESSPADKAGIEVNDRIIKVNGADIRMLEYEDSISLFTEAMKSSPSLTVRKYSDGSEITVKLTSGAVNIPNISYKELDGGVGYLLIRQFAGKEFNSLLSDAEKFFKDRGISKIILDLRDNPGGDFVFLLSTLNMFIPEKNVKLFDVVTRGKTTTYFSDGTDTKFSDVLVLVNGASASSSEICAGVLSDTGYGKILGTETYGKGRGQTTMSFFDDSVIHLSMSEVVLPVRGKYHGEEITPDIVSERVYTTVINYKDITVSSDEINESSEKWEIEMLQDMLYVMGYLGEFESGKYDDATKDAVKTVQRAFDANESGYLTKYLFEKLFDSYSVYNDAYFEDDTQLTDALEYINK